MNLPAGLLGVPGNIGKVQWFFMLFCKLHRLAFKEANNDLNTMTIKQVTEFVQVQWIKDKDSSKLARLKDS